MPTVKQLQAQLKKKGLDTVGKKAELEARLAEAEAASAPAAEAESEEAEAPPAKKPKAAASKKAEAAAKKKAAADEKKAAADEKKKKAAAAKAKEEEEAEAAAEKETEAAAKKEAATAAAAKEKKAAAAKAAAAAAEEAQAEAAAAQKKRAAATAAAAAAAARPAPAAAAAAAPWEAPLHSVAAAKPAAPAAAAAPAAVISSGFGSFGDDDDAPAAAAAAPSGDAASKLSKKEAKRAKLLALREKMNEARKQNYDGVREETKAAHTGGNEHKRKHAEWVNKQKDWEKSKAADGEDMTKPEMYESASSAAEKTKKQKKKDKNKASFGWEVFNQDNLFRAYKKRASGAFGGSESEKADYSQLKHAYQATGGNFYPTANEMDYGAQSETGSAAQAIPEANIARMVNELDDAAARRKNFSRRRTHNDEKDVDSINERNAVFNRKVGRAFDKYTVEIRQNLERGTALPN